MDIGKGLDPHVRPKRQKPMTSSTDIRSPVYKPRIGQGRAGVKRRVRTALASQPKQTLAPATKSMPEVAAQPQVTQHNQSMYHQLKLTLDSHYSPMIVTRKVPIFPDPLLRPPPKLHKT